MQPRCKGGKETEDNVAILNARIIVIICSLVTFSLEYSMVKILTEVTFGACVLAPSNSFLGLFPL